MLGYLFNISKLDLGVLFSQYSLAPTCYKVRPAYSIPTLNSPAQGLNLPAQKLLCPSPRSSFLKNPGNVVIRPTCRFGLLAAVHGFPYSLNLSPSLSLYDPAYSGHVYSELFQMLLPLAILSILSTINFFSPPYLGVFLSFPFIYFLFIQEGYMAAIIDQDFFFP